MKKIFLTMFIVSFAFGWQIPIGEEWSDYGESIIPTSDGGCLVSGISEHPSAYWFNAHFSKLSITGVVQWDHYIGNDWYQDGGFTSEELDDGYLLMGWTESFGAIGKDIFIRKVSLSGDSLWQKKYGTSSSDIPHASCAVSSGGFIIAGESHGFSAGGDADIYILRIDDEGDTLWTSHFGDSPKNETAHDIINTSDGGFLIAGKSWVSSAMADSNLLALKIDAEGNLEWLNEFGGSNDDVGWGCCELSSGDFCVVGQISLIPLHSDIWTLYLNSDGDSIGSNIFSTAGQDCGHSVLETDDGNLVMGGWMSYNAFLMKFSYEGAQIWLEDIGGVYDDRFFDIQQREDGGFYAMGYTKSFGSGTPDEPNYFVVSTNSVGDPGTDCFPASISTRSPAFDSSYVMCTDIGMVVAMYDPYSFAIDEDKLWMHRLVYHEDGTTDTTFFHDTSEFLTYEDAGTLKVIIDGDYEETDYVTIFVDSCYNVEDCKTIFDHSSTFYFATHSMAIGTINPVPFSDVPFDGLEDIDVNFNVTYVGPPEFPGIDYDNMFITWARWRSTTSSWLWIDTVFTETEMSISPATMSVGDSIKLCLHIPDFTIAGLLCPANSIDSCWLYYLTESGAGATHNYELISGWNLLSSPFAGELNISESFEDYWEPAYFYRNIVSNYEIITDIEAGIGFWLLYPDTTDIEVIAPNFETSITWILEDGWNLVGVGGLPVATGFLTTSPDVYELIYSFEDGVYSPVDFLYPGVGYWVLAFGRVEIDL